MTPKEKAKELFNKHLSLISIESPIDKVSAIPYIKQCALIAVDEILDAIVIINEYDFEPLNDYWQEVIKEIEAL